MSDIKQRVEAALHKHMRCVDNNFYLEEQVVLAGLVKELTEREAKLVEALKCYILHDNGERMIAKDTLKELGIEG